MIGVVVFEWLFEQANKQMAGFHPKITNMVFKSGAGSQSCSEGEGFICFIYPRSVVG